MKYQVYTLYILLIIVYSCNKSKTENTTEPENIVPVITIDTLQGKSLMGENLISGQVNFTQDSIQIKNYKAALDNYKKDSSSIDNIIWLGRRIAYLGDYKKAISIFSEGIEKHPDEPQLYRHRGHRYISLRKFDKAISDLSKAAELIEGKEDIVEQDGIPNRLNQPVSTLHTNIYYHLGLAYYLKNDLVKAEEIFRKCLEASKNDDMQVATRHWLYMILKLQDKDEEAMKILEPVRPEMNIIENDAYHQLLLFYKGIKSEGEIIGNESTGSSEAVKYGIANWYFYNDQKEKAIELFEELVDTGNWAGFGYIAVEAQLSNQLKD